MNVEVSNDINVSGGFVRVTGAVDSVSSGATAINLIADADDSYIGNINFGTSTDELTSIDINSKTTAIEIEGGETNFYTTGDIDIGAGTGEDASVEITGWDGLTFQANNIDIEGGAGDFASVKIVTDTFNDGALSFQAAGDIKITGGSASDSFVRISSADQDIDAGGDINLIGGYEEGSSVSIFGENQEIDATNITLRGGDDGDDTNVSIQNTSGTQRINTSGKLTLQAGYGFGSDVDISDRSVSMTSQYITALGGIDLIATSDTNAELYSDLNQVITVGSASESANFTLQGEALYGQQARVISQGDQSITVHGDLILDGGNISAAPTSGDATITVDDLVVNGSSTFSYTSGGSGGGCSECGGSEGAGEIIDPGAAVATHSYTLITNGQNSVVDITAAGGTLGLEGVHWENRGTTEWLNGDILFEIGSNPLYETNLENYGTFKLSAEGATFSFEAGSVNNYAGGTVIKDSGTGTTNFNVFFSNEGGLLEAQSGTIDFGANGFFSQNSGETLLKGGNLDASYAGFTFAGGQLNGGTNGVITTGGQLIGDVFLQNTSVAPGHSPGSLTVTGNLDSTGGNTFNMEAEGASTGQFDTLNVTGTAQFDTSDSATIIYSNGFTGPAPSVFNITGAVTGSIPALTETIIGGTGATTTADGSIAPVVTEGGGVPAPTSSLDVGDAGETDDLILVFLLTSEEDSDLIGGSEEESDEEKKLALESGDSKEKTEEKEKGAKMCLAV